MNSDFQKNLLRKDANVHVSIWNPKYISCCSSSVKALRGLKIKLLRFSCACSYTSEPSQAKANYTTSLCTKTNEQRFPEESSKKTPKCKPFVDPFENLSKRVASSRRWSRSTVTYPPSIVAPPISSLQARAIPPSPVLYWSDCDHETQCFYGE